MTSYISIAQTINELKPNLKEFWSTISVDTVHSEFEKLLKLAYTPLNLFKLELLMIYMETHNNIYVNTSMKIHFTEYLRLAGIDYSALVNKYGHITGFYLPIHGTISSKIILGNVLNPKQYCNPYLRSKLNPINSTNPTSTAYIKVLEPNHMSLAIFQQWLTTVKSLNSVQALTFIKQCARFPNDFKNLFINSILGHCPKPSIELQKYLTEYCGVLDNYPSIYRHAIRAAARKHLTFEAIFDERDSEYKPFVANINRLSPTTQSELESTIGTALVLLQQPEYSQVLYDELIKHAQQAPTDLLSTYRTNLLIAQQALTKLIKDL